MNPITQWNPFSELDKMNHFFQGAFGARSPQVGESTRSMDWAPRVDVVEDAERYLVRAELPDIRKEDIRISVRDGRLTLSGERKAEQEYKNKKIHRIERSFGSFMRSFELPDDVDTRKIEATFKEGILSLSLLKSTHKEPESIQVEIK